MLIATVKLKNWLVSWRITFRVYLPTVLPSIQSTISRSVFLLFQFTVLAKFLNLTFSWCSTSQPFIALRKEDKLKRFWQLVLKVTKRIGWSFPAILSYPLFVKDSSRAHFVNTVKCLLKLNVYFAVRTRNAQKYLAGSVVKWITHRFAVKKSPWSNACTIMWRPKWRKLWCANALPANETLLKQMVATKW